jgi:hypothetical protein
MGDKEKSSDEKGVPLAAFAAKITHPNEVSEVADRNAGMSSRFTRSA